MRLQAIFGALFCLGLALPGSAPAGPALLIDAADGRVLYAEDQDHQWYPASLTKIMTAYLAFEALRAGTVTRETKIICSESAHGQPPSKVGLPVGAEMTVELALRALIIKSANDVAVMLAEAIAGSEEAFVHRMNATAQRLGMTRTRFVNANGLPAPEQVSTARDLARLSRAVLRDFPEYGHYWSQVDMHIGRRRLGSHNGLLRTYDGADGLKTGFICDSGFNVVASATRDGRRLLAVVLGEASGRDRTVRAASLLEHGFQSYGWKTMFNAPSLDAHPEAPDAKGAVSVREAVVSWECGGRRRVRAVARARIRAKLAKAGGEPPAVAGQAQPAGSDPATNGAKPAAAATAPAQDVPPRPKKKAAAPPPAAAKQQ